MRKAILLVLLGMPLAACADLNPVADSEGQPSPYFGQAVHNNIAAQVANPEAPVQGQPAAMDGQRAGLAQERYAKGKVIKPSSIDVDNTVGNSASGGSTQ